MDRRRHYLAREAAVRGALVDAHRGAVRPIAGRRLPLQAFSDVMKWRRDDIDKQQRRLGEWCVAEAQRRNGSNGASNAEEVAAEMAARSAAWRHRAA